MQSGWGDTEKPAGSLAESGLEHLILGVGGRVACWRLNHSMSRGPGGAELEILLHHGPAV